MSSNPMVREIVLDEICRGGGALTGDSIADIRCGTDLQYFSNKQVRRAIESLRYGHGEIKLSRPRLDEFNRGWHVERL